MCAVVLRERQERAALVRGACSAVGAILNLNPGVLAKSFDEYFGLLARRDLDVETLREYVDDLRRAHERIVRRERDDKRLLRRLEAMGEHADRVWGATSTTAANAEARPPARRTEARPPSRR